MKIIIQWITGAIFILVFIGCAAWITGFAYNSALSITEQNVGGSFVTGNKYYLSAGSGTTVDAGEISATTTKVYITTSATASSTITGILDTGDQIDIKLRAVASSSVANLRFVIETSDNNVDFYPIEEATTTTSVPIVLTVGEIQHNWGLATSTPPLCGTNEVCKDITIKDIYSKYFRIRFGITGANAAVWGSASVRTIIPN